MTGGVTMGTNESRVRQKHFDGGVYNIYKHIDRGVPKVAELGQVQQRTLDNWPCRQLTDLFDYKIRKRDLEVGTQDEFETSRIGAIR
jgi:hypothetical protein